MTPVERLLSKLPHAKRNGQGWVARCPAHDDKRPSLSIAPGLDGRALVHCHGGCSTEDIVAAMGLTLADLMPASDHPPPRKKPPAGKPRGAITTARVYQTARDAVAELERVHGRRAAWWTYHNADGEPVGVVVRWNTPAGKEIRPASLDAEGWRIGAMREPRPLYRLPELLSRTGEVVYIVEGEKCADALAQLGLLATTSSGGSQAAAKTDWRPLAGRDVVIVPDADNPGAKYAGDVAAILVKLSPPARVRVVRLCDAWPDLPHGGDIADVLASGEDADTIKEKLAALAAGATRKAAGPVLVRLADIEPREIRWLWPGRVPLGRLSLLVGRPGEGKSLLTIDMAARVSTGSPWPDESGCAPMGSVILICAEDDPADTIRPRLDAHHADVRKVHLLSTVRRADPDSGDTHEAMFTLADVAALEAALRAVPDCRLIVIDPIGSFLGGGTDAHRDNEVRGVLAPVARLAEKYGPAVLVVAHRRKASGPSADELALGSRAFTGITRAVWHLARDRQNKTRRLLLPGKNNLAPEGTGLAFSIGGNPPSIVWEHDPVPMTADDALAAENGDGDESKPGPEPQTRSQAGEWLRELLKAGPMESARIKDEANAAGYTWRTVHRAKDELGIKPYRERFAGPWLWKLPPDPCHDLSCHVPEKRENLASWHDSKNLRKNAENELGTCLSCQDKSTWHDSSEDDADGRDWGAVE